MTEEIKHINKKNQEYIAEGNRMTKEIIIDVSNCSRKRDDDCMEVPICNEYGDLMGYQSCEAQTLCPYRSQKKIERLEQENKELKKFFDSAAKKNTSLENKIKEYCERYDELYWTTDQLVKDKTKLKQTLEEISGLAEKSIKISYNLEVNSMLYDIKNKINEVLK